MNMIQIPDDMNDSLAEAVRCFWETRGVQMRSNVLRDHGNRSAVTGGKQLDGFVKLVRDVLVCNGVPETCIFANSHLELPGYFRPTKKWDMLVVDGDTLVIAIEFKSQVGPSFGNNFNNRTEEAMGSALDIWTAYREGVFGAQAAPWLGYFMVIEDCSKSNEPVRAHSWHFPVLREFEAASYIERYERFCEKLLLERQYGGACLLTTSLEQGTYAFPQEQLSLDSFLFSMLGAAMSHFGRRRH